MEQDPANALQADSFLRFNATAIFEAGGKLAQRLGDLPSRALARLRKLDELGQDLHEVAQVSQQAERGDVGRGQGYRRQRNVGNGTTPPIPGPWGFLTSGYFVGLFIMAFLLNRIQNIVVPPRRPLAFRLQQNALEVQRRRLFSWRYALIGAFFPVDFSSTFSRTMFRLPSLYFLGKAVGIWLIILLQAHDPSLLTRYSWLSPIGEYVTQMKIEDVCWHTFLTACFALCIGTLTTGLEGLNINDSAPFNLFAFAFQLYVESASHLAPKEGEPMPRPNVHVVITVLLPLLQLTVMHTLEIKHHWSRYRLAFSTLGSTLALAHFHYVVWRSPVPYPLTTYAARVVESLMAAVIALTVALNALTQLLAEGALTRPLFAHAALMPRPDEDFNVALFRLGTASMEATAVAGLGNEVGAVVSAHAHPASRPRSRHSTPSPTLVPGELEIDRTGVSSLAPAHERRTGAVRRGFTNEIVRVRVKAARTDFWLDTVLNVAWQRHLGAFLLSAWRAAKRLWAAGVGRVRSAFGERERERERSPSLELLDGPPEGMPTRVVRATSVEADPYARFLRGEPVSDDEDEFQPDERATPAPDALSSDSEDGDEEGEDDVIGYEDADDRGEQAELYADLSTSDATSAPLLLAHMTDSSPAPLTRKAYRRLVSAPRRDAMDDWTGFVDERRREKRTAAREQEQEEAESPRACVICTVEPRDIICWPCRCLALCDDCRNNLASRSAASKHTCPCCRRSVEGYSKIYIP